MIDDQRQMELQGGLLHPALGSHVRHPKYLLTYSFQLHELWGILRTSSYNRTELSKNPIPCLAARSCPSEKVILLKADWSFLFPTRTTRLNRLLLVNLRPSKPPSACTRDSLKLVLYITTKPWRLFHPPRVCRNVVLLRTSSWLPLSRKSLYGINHIDQPYFVTF